MKTKILENEKNSYILESLYRSNPQEFKDAFLEIYEDNPDSEIFQVWYERLFFEDKYDNIVPQKKSKISKNFIVTLILCIFAGFFVKLPDIFKFISNEHFNTRDLFSCFLPLLAIYYLINKKTKKIHWFILATVIIFALIYINLIPNNILDPKSPDMADTSILVFIHMPIFLWFITGVSFITPLFKNIENRINFLRFNGEIFVYSSLIGAGWVVLTGATALLFSVAGIESGDFLTQWLIFIGFATTPILAVSILCNTKIKIKLASLLSKIFAPLFALVLLVFIVITKFNPSKLFTEREILLGINIFLLLVVAINTFVSIDKQSDKTINFFDYNNLLLLLASFFLEIHVMINIISRLTSLGFTPNRTALVGINILILIHLIGMIIFYIRWFTKKVDKSNGLSFIANYIPVYFYWSIFMVFIFPWLFSIR